MTMKAPIDAAIFYTNPSGEGDLSEYRLRMAAPGSDELKPTHNLSLVAAVLDLTSINIEFDYSCLLGLDDQTLYSPNDAFAAMCWADAVYEPTYLFSDDERRTSPIEYRHTHRPWDYEARDDITRTLSANHSLVHEPCLKTSQMDTFLFNTKYAPSDTSSEVSSSNASSASSFKPPGIKSDAMKPIRPVALSRQHSDTKPSRVVSISSYFPTLHKEMFI